MRGFALAATAALIGLAVAAPASAGIDGIAPTGHIGADGWTDGMGVDVLTGTHFYTFWTAATYEPGSSAELSYQVWAKVHDDADICCAGFMYDAYLPSVSTDLTPFTVGDGDIHMSSSWVLKPTDYQTYTPDFWGPGNGGTTRYHYLGQQFFSVYFGPEDAGMPYWFTVDDADAMRAVPEPATWTMMIAGFGLAGAALRRRRALAA